MENKDLEILRHQIKLLNTMITATDNFKLDFFSFIIENNLTEKQTKAIVQGLVILKDRMLNGEISDEHRTLFADSEALTILDKDIPPSIDDFKQLVSTLIGEQINIGSLLTSLVRQGINKDFCQSLLDDIKK